MYYILQQSKFARLVSLHCWNKLPSALSPASIPQSSIIFTLWLNLLHVAASTIAKSTESAISAGHLTTCCGSTRRTDRLAPPLTRVTSRRHLRLEHQRLAACEINLPGRRRQRRFPMLNTFTSYPAAASRSCYPSLEPPGAPPNRPHSLEHFYWPVQPQA